MDEIEKILKAKGIKYGFDPDKKKFYLLDRVIYIFSPEDGTWTTKPIDVIGFDVDDGNKKRSPADQGSADRIELDRSLTKTIEYSDKSSKIIAVGKNINLLKVLGGEHPPRPKFIEYDYILSVVTVQDYWNITTSVLTESSIIP